jgi:signal peptidase I
MAGLIKPHMTSRKTEEAQAAGKKKDDEGSIRYIKELNDSKILWLLIVALFMIYLVTTKFSPGLAPVFAVLVALVMVSLVALEVWIGAKTGGLGNEVKETALAVFVAAVLWYGGGLLLGTSVPLDAVVSCSMLPSLNRGDMLVLHGGEVQAPVVKMSAADWNVVKMSGLLKRQCTLCQDGSSLQGCVGDGNGGVAQPSGILDYKCSLCERQDKAGNRTFGTCVTGVEINGKDVDYSKSEETIVYMPKPGDPFAASGDIVHRARFIIEVDGKEYILTKGDNNYLFDAQIGNSPVEPAQVKGRALVRLPYVGYLKLFLAGMFGEPAGCDSQFTGTQAVSIPVG